MGCDRLLVAQIRSHQVLPVILLLLLGNGCVAGNGTDNDTDTDTDNEDVVAEGCKPLDYACDCFFDSLEITAPELVEARELSLCTDVGRSLQQVVEFEVRACPICGCSTCRLDGLFLVLIGPDGRSNEVIDEQENWISAVIPELPTGEAQVGGEYPTGGRFTVVINYTPEIPSRLDSEGKRRPDTVSLHIRLNCRSPGSPLPITLSLTAVSSGECD